MSCSELHCHFFVHPGLAPSDTLHLLAYNALAIPHRQLVTILYTRNAAMTRWLFGRDQKEPEEVPFCPIKPSNEQYISEEAFRQRRNAATEAELGR